MSISSSRFLRSGQGENFGAPERYFPLPTALRRSSSSTMQRYEKFTISANDSAKNHHFLGVFLSIFANKSSKRIGQFVILLLVTLLLFPVFEKFKKKTILIYNIYIIYKY